MEETNKRDGGGRGEKRRRHDDELEAVAAELAWRPALVAAVAAVVAAATVAAAAAQSGLPRFLVRKGQSCAWLKKTPKKQSPYFGTGTPRIGLGRDLSMERSQN